MCQGAWRAAGAPDRVGYILNGSMVSDRTEQCIASRLCAVRGEWDPARWKEMYAPGTALPPRGLYCIETCGTRGFMGAHGHVMGVSCALRDINECLEGGQKCTGGMYCNNKAPVFGIEGYRCVCAADTFATTDPAPGRGCSTSGVEFVFYVTPRNASVLQAPRQEQQDQALLVTVVQGLYVDGAIRAATHADVAAVLRSSVVDDGKVNVRIAGFFMQWDFLGSHAASVERVLSLSTDYELVGAVTVTARDTGSELSAQSHSFMVQNISYVGLVVVVDIVLSPAVLSSARTPVFYLSAFNDTVVDAETLEARVCRTDVGAAPQNVRCCLHALAAAHTVTRTTAGMGRLCVHGSATGGAEGLPSLLDGAFWEDSNTSRAESTGPQNMRLQLATGDLEVHGFPGRMGGGSIEYTFVVGVLFIKTDAATGATLHVQDTTHTVRATMSLMHQAILAQSIQGMLNTPIDIALYRVLSPTPVGENNQTQRLYSESVEVVLNVGTATVAALEHSPVFFASSLQWAIGSKPELVAVDALVHACSPGAAKTVMVHSDDTCAAEKVQ